MTRDVLLTARGEEEFWRLPRVIAVTGKSRSSIYADKSFPRPIKLSDRCSAWLASEIRAWQRGRIEASRERRGAL